jgi:hypothetical protein
MMLFGSLRIILGVDRDRALDKTNAGEDEKDFVQRPIAIDSKNYPKRTEEHYK